MIAFGEGSRFGVMGASGDVAREGSDLANARWEQGPRQTTEDDCTQSEVRLGSAGDRCEQSTVERYQERQELLEERFQRLAIAWREECGPTSSITEMAMQPSYQQIIGMGHDALPLLLLELEDDPDHWFWALKAITGEDPVPPQSKGRLSEMAKAWLSWGRENHLI